MLSGRKRPGRRSHPSALGSPTRPQNPSYPLNFVTTLFTPKTSDRSIYWVLLHPFLRLVYP